MVGANTVEVKVLAQDGVTETIYTVTVDRAESPNANLASLATSTGTLAPVFSPAQLGYTVNVQSTVTSLTVTPTVQEPNATIEVNGTAVASGVASGAITLNTGATVITVDVLAQNGVDTQAYTITVNRSSVVVSDQADSGVKNNLLVKALDITGTPDGPLVYTITTPPTEGTLIKANESDTVEIADGNYRYRPDLGYKGLDSFTYQVSDNSGFLGEATVTINIVERPPFWSYEGGSILAKQKGVYAGAPGSVTPGARSGAATWSDGQGKLYVFGGLGMGSLKGPGALNDLWVLDLDTKVWTFLGGGTDINGAPIFGAGATPGARSGATTWMDAAGDLWLFGGLGRDASPTGFGPLNDLWKYDVSAGAWNLVSGSSVAKVNGVYTGSSPVPGGRSFAAGWMDQAGNLYLFGGNGMANFGTAIAVMNDLWKYDVNANTWTHLKGAPIAKSVSIFGVKGVPNNSNTPGARSGSSAWVGPDGMFYLFGGSANNDLWKYNPSANIWTWINGQTKPAGKGVYAVLGVADSRNEPAARSGASSWVAPDGSLMLFGGLGPRDDVWSYNLSTNLWTWVKGSPLAGAKPVYGTLGEGAEPNTPGARQLTSLAVDAKGDVWTFGGVNGANSFNDLFKLDVAAESLATTLAASNATTTSITLEGFVNPNGFATSGFFRYGKLLDLSDATEVPTSLVDGATAQNITETVSGLEQGTIYYFQAVAKNAFSTSYGAIYAKSTDGTAASTIQFATPDSTVSESVGTHLVTIVLSTPSATELVVPITGASGPIRFLPGQTTAVVPVTIDNNRSVGSNATITLVLGTIPGGYTLVGATSHPITVEDDDQALTVVDHPKSQFVAVKGTLDLSVEVTGSGPITYQWKKAGKAIKGATSATYKVYGVTAAAAGAYTVDVSNSVGPVPVNAAAVYVVDATPKSFVTTIGKAVTMSVTASGPGPVTYLWKKGASPALGVNNAKTYLPPVTAADTSVYVCEVTGGGTVVGKGGENTLRVAAATAVTYPPEMIGTYMSIIDRDPAVGNNLGVRLDLTTTSAGAFTAKLTGDGVASTLKGVMIPTLSGSAATEATGSAVFTRKGKSSLTLVFKVDAADGITGHLLEEDTNELVEENTNAFVTFTGYRNKWLATKSLPAAYYLDAASKPSPYTFALEIPSTLAGALDIPQGNGFGSFTPTADGKATVVGFTADGFAYTSAGFVGPTGQVGIYSLFKARVGSIAGTGNIALSGAAGVNNTFQGEFTWSKQAALATAKDQLYRAGFAPMALTIIGGKYKAPVIQTPVPNPGDNPVVAGLSNQIDNVRIAFAEGGLADGQINGGFSDAKTNTVVFSIRNLKPTTGIVQTVGLPLLAANPNGLKFALAAKPLGQFSGTFTLPNANKLLVRTAKYQGMIVWTGSAYIAPGYFILNQLPEPGQTVTTSTQLSGVLDLEPNP